MSDASLYANRTRRDLPGSQNYVRFPGNDYLIALTMQIGGKYVNQ